MSDVHIGSKIKREIEGMIDTLLTKNLEKINQAYLEADDSLSISFPVKLNPGKPGTGVEVEVTINFVESRVKETMKTTVNEKQIDMFQDAIPDENRKAG